MLYGFYLILNPAVIFFFFFSELPGHTLRNGIFPAGSVNKDVHSPERSQPLPLVSAWAPRELRKQRTPGGSRAPWWETQGGKSSHALWRDTQGGKTGARPQMTGWKAKAGASHSLRPRGRWPTRLLCPWNSPGKNPAVGTILFPRGSSGPRGWTWVSCTAGGFFSSWATREAP